MSVILDGTTLPDLLFVNQLFSNSTVAAESAYADDGTPLIYEGNVTEFDLSLYGGNDFGWIYHSVLEALSVKANAKGAFMTLSYESTLYTVRFKHEAPPVLSALPIVGRPNVASGDWFNNVLIKLMGSEA